ncbi:MAG: type 1 glutamine amidotransferase domain-containing protein [Nitrospirota bacterium]
MKALIITADEVEDLELFYPYYRIKEAGWDITVAAPREGQIKGKHGYTVPVDIKFSDVNPGEYDLLVVPGGKAPEEVRLDEDALNIVRHFFKEEKYVAAICHGPQVLISAGELAGKNATCWPAIRDDVIAAGAKYRDKEVLVDGNLITSRKPDDLPAFMREVMEAMTDLTKLAGEREKTKIRERKAA